MWLMGKITRTEPGERIPGVYGVENDVEYVYCDKCGSFSIEMKRRPRSSAHSLFAALGILISVSAAILILVGAILTHTWLLACLLIVPGFLALAAASPRSLLKCRRCGNESISDANVLHYPLDDRTIFDVPDSLIMARVVETRVL
jgi:ribosomal protein L37E